MTELAFPSLAGGEKRIVFFHPNGIAQICGAAVDYPVVIDTPFPSMGVMIPFVSLVRVTARAAYFKAPHVPQSFNSPLDVPTFHAEQR